MNTTNLKLWEILIPKNDNEGYGFEPSVFNEFEQFVIDTVGGYTYLDTPAKAGVYKMDDGSIATDYLITLQIAAMPAAAKQIARAAARIFKQETVMIYVVSDYVDFIKPD